MPELPLRNLYWILIFSVSSARSLEERVVFFFLCKKGFYPYKIHRDLAHIKSARWLRRWERISINFTRSLSAKFRFAFFFFIFYFYFRSSARYT